MSPRRTLLFGCKHNTSTGSFNAGNAVTSQEGGDDGGLMMQIQLLPLRGKPRRHDCTKTRRRRGGATKESPRHPQPLSARNTGVSRKCVTRQDKTCLSLLPAACSICNATPPFFSAHAAQEQSTPSLAAI
jgi:hypothetical protein